MWTTKSGKGYLGRLRAVILLLATLTLGAIGLGAGLIGADDGGSEPAAPAGVTAVNGEATGMVIVGWEAVGSAAFYRIGWVALDDIPATQSEGREWLDAFIFTSVGNLGQTEYAVSGVTPGRRYAFVVASVSSRFGAGAWSEWAYLTPAAAGTATPTPTPSAVAPTPTPTPAPSPTPTPTLTPAEVAAVERAALTAFYYATDGDNWGIDDHNWLSDQPLGEWSGVTTDHNGSVIVLWTPVAEPDSDSGSSSGPANPFDEEWSLAGEIPGELGSLSNLVSLHLGHNGLTGEIPAELGRLGNLYSLDLSSNLLSERIPAELGNLAKLHSLRLDSNRLTGTVPAALGRLDSLHLLDLRGNQLTGRIPAELGNLANLHSLYLKGNELTGCIPAALRDVPHNDLTSLRLPFCAP